MKFQSVKHALGHYAARRKGPQLTQCEVSERIQCGPMRGDVWLILIGSAIHSPAPNGLGLPQGSERAEALIDWASRADDGWDGGPLARRLARILRERGLIEVKQAPLCTARATFVDLNTGEQVTTMAGHLQAPQKCVTP